MIDINHNIINMFCIVLLLDTLIYTLTQYYGSMYLLPQCTVGVIKVTLILNVPMFALNHAAQ